ncbi:AMP-binding protein, partial [Rhizobiaceae sp. 2RAB30]
MRVEAFLRDSAAADPEGIAVVADGMRLSYGELNELSDRLGSSLRERGVARGDRVILLLENIWETAVAIFAVLKVGAVFCPVNPSVKADWLGQIMRDCRPSAVLTQAKYVKLCTEAAGTLRPLVIAARGAGTSGGDTVAFEDCISAPGEVSPAQVGIDAD